jgi:nucleoside-diphosphate-sugar epimerase
MMLASLASCHNADNNNNDDVGGIVLVLGATGRTGSLLYHQLLMQRRSSSTSTSNANVRALVRSVDKAREILHCNACNETDGIYQGDIRNLTSLLAAFENVQTIAIATGVSGRGSPSTSDIRAVEFTGIQNAVRALAQQQQQQGAGSSAGGVLPVQADRRRVVLCSSRGTTTPPSNTSSKMFGDILFYKLNAEAFLGSVGMVTSIVKPCGLSSADAGNNRTLIALHDDDPTPTGSQMIPRDDVARVMAHLVLSPPRQNLRFDLCSIQGPATTDLEKLVDSAKWDWQQSVIGAGATQEEKHIPKINLHEAVSRTMQSIPSRFIPAK